MENRDQSQTLARDGVSVSLTYDCLDVSSVVKSVRSSKAGATVLFAGTTRDHFDNKPVVQLQYTAYIPRALQSMLSIAENVKETYSLTAITMVHRLGICPIGEESILIAVSAPHRHAAWEGGQQALENCKERVEVWKMEVFDGNEGGIWRANRDGTAGEKVGKGLFEGTQ